MKQRIINFLICVLGLTTLITSVYISWWLFINVFLPVFVVVGAISLIAYVIYKAFKVGDSQ